MKSLCVVLFSLRVLLHTTIAEEDDSNSAAAVLLSEYAARLQALEDGLDSHQGEIESVKTAQSTLESKIQKSMLEILKASTSTTTTPATPTTTTSTTEQPKTSKPVSAVQTPTRDWKYSEDSKWAFSCDWVGGDIGSQKSTGEKCGGICWNRADCTHFTWTDWAGGTCWLKGAGVNPTEVTQTSGNAVCGQVNSSGQRSNWNWKRSGNVQWDFGCDFIGGDIANHESQGEGCGGLCENDRRCTHFTWTDWNSGTCWLKGQGVHPHPVAKKSDNSVCGWVNR